MPNRNPTPEITASFATMTVTTRSQSKRQPVVKTEAPSDPGAGPAEATEDVSMSESEKSPSEESTQSRPDRKPATIGLGIQIPGGGGGSGNGGSSNGNGDSDDSDDADDDSEDSSEDSSEDEPQTAVQSRDSHIIYDLSSLTPNARRRFNLGINPAMAEEVAVRSFWTVQGDQGEAVAFKVTEASPHQVSVPLSYSAAPNCTCGKTDQGTACKHVYWLEDQLLAAAYSNKPLGVVTPTISGELINGQSPSDVIKMNFGLQGLASNRKWLLQPPSANPRDVDENEILEMLSVFEPNNYLPFEDLDDRLDPIPQNRRIYSAKYFEFGKVIARRAFSDPPLAWNLREIAPPEFQAYSFFEKIHWRVEKAFRLLDDYVQTGPTGSGGEYDVIKTGNILEDLVRKIGCWYEKHIYQATSPDVRDTAAVAMRVLTEMLFEVASRDRNEYAGYVWAENILTQQSEVENNLYARLIRGRHTDRTEELFVLGVLQKIQQSADPLVLRQHLERLKSLEARIRSQGAPDIFQDTFSSIIRAVNRKRSAPEAAGGSASRQRER